MLDIGIGGNRFRALVARVLLVALLLPGVFSLTSPDPQWLLGVEREPIAHHHPDGTAHQHSAIPGSAGHPADHDCAPCQVLKYLAVGLSRALAAAVGLAKSRPSKERLANDGEIGS